MKLTKSLKTLALLTLGGGIVFAQQPINSNYAYSGPPQNFGFSTGNNATFISIPVSSVATITKVTVTVNISYPLVWDLNMYLFGPDGTRTELLAKACVATTTATLVNITFDDSASTAYTASCPTAPGGSFKGDQPLSVYNGKSAAGRWTLAVQNSTTPANSGVVNGVSISITGTVPILPTISANTIYNPLTLLNGPIAPGQILAIGGSDIGPATAVTAPAANLPTTLGGTQVLINGTLPAPIFFSSAGLVGAVLPYSAVGGGPVVSGTVTLTVVYNGVTSNSVTLNVTLASPGLFPVQTNDTYQNSVKAINPDGTLNSASNPVAAGSTVAIYAGSLGPVTPAFTAGQIAPSSPLYTTTAQTFVSFAGQAGTVLFSGLAPGTYGVYQVNVQIPVTVPSGAQPVLLWNSAGASQSGLPIYIK